MKIVNIKAGKLDAYLDETFYWPMRRAILQVLPTYEQGLTWAELVEAVRPHLPASLFEKDSEIRWYTKAVQLDLEARGLIQRMPIRGLRLCTPRAMAA
ncbi:MAG: hypothetical protein RhofKO_03990 [Rhodothermales bacterium]